jgi:flavin-dependent dehydrogenase
MLTRRVLDGSGWIWTIRLHNGTTSVGVVMNQEVSTQTKKTMNLSGREFYSHMVQNTPGITELCKDAELVSDIKYASDWSYSAAHYASLNTRVAGDAGCFIDPYFSSGVHLAVASGLSAAASICAAIRGNCNETDAAKWHTAKVATGYTRFLLVVMSALKQITRREELVLGDIDEKSFDRAFSLFRPSKHCACQSFRR